MSTVDQIKRPYDRTSHILIVDDDDTLLKFFKIHLNKFFSKVLVVENAKEAMDAIKTKEIDMVLTDIRMPKVDGLQLMQKIQKSRPDLPILLISGEPMTDEQQQIVDLADGFLSKPFSVDQLNAYINHGIDKRMILKDLSNCLKDPLKIRKSLTAQPKDLAKLTKKDEQKKAEELIGQWKSSLRDQIAA
jgi:DNA-binding NtrC family response regulator